MKILIDNGHGSNTPGKQSPDRRLREYEWAREIATRIVVSLKEQGYAAEQIVTEETDVSLSERCRRVNLQCERHGAGNVVLLSIHSNAAGNDGKWKTAGGWSVYTSPGKTKADELATILWNTAQEELKPYIEKFRVLKAGGAYDSNQQPIRADWSDGDPDYEARFAILTGTKCAAVLTESMFHDNRADVDFMLSEAGKQAIVKLHVNGIIEYMRRIKEAVNR